MSARTTAPVRHAASADRRAALLAMVRPPVEPSIDPLPRAPSPAPLSDGDEQARIRARAASLRAASVALRGRAAEARAGSLAARARDCAHGVGHGA